MIQLRQRKLRAIGSGMNSRALTARCALERLTASGSLVLSGDCPVLSLHFVGADECEVSEPAQLLGNYEALLSFLVGKGYRDVHMVFVGPNLKADLNGCGETFVFDTLSVHVRTDTRYYHDFIRHLYPRDSVLTLTQPMPSCVLLFNAGLWGYDSWSPTLRELFCSSGLLVGVPVVVTSYTLEESEDDYDTIYSIAANSERESDSDSENKPQSTTSLEWLWDCEENPNKGGHVTRATQPEARAYTDNGFWQAVVTVSTAFFELDRERSAAAPTSARPTALVGTCSEG